MCFVIQQTIQKKVGTWKGDDSDTEEVYDNVHRRNVWSIMQRVNADEYLIQESWTIKRIFFLLPSETMDKGFTVFCEWYLG